MYEGANFDPFLRFRRLSRDKAPSNTKMDPKLVTQPSWVRSMQGQSGRCLGKSGLSSNIFTGVKRSKVADISGLELGPSIRD